MAASWLASNELTTALGGGEGDHGANNQDACHAMWPTRQRDQFPAGCSDAGQREACNLCSSLQCFFWQYR